MKIIAGARGAGKTYDLMHLAAADPDGYFVATDYRMAKYHRQEYRDLIDPERIISQTQVTPEMNPINIYVDQVKSGEELPTHWTDHHNLKAIAVVPKETWENAHLPLEYTENIMAHYGWQRISNKK